MFFVLSFLASFFVMEVPPLIMSNIVPDHFAFHFGTYCRRSSNFECVTGLALLVTTSWVDTTHLRYSLITHRRIEGAQTS